MNYKQLQKYLFTEECLDQGPIYVEGILDKISEHIFGEVREELFGPKRYQEYLQILKTEIPATKHKNPVFHFLYGFCNDQAASIFKNDGTQHFHIDHAINNYKNYLSLGIGGQECRFFAQWRIAHLLFSLNYNWSIIEENHLKALEINPARGESIQDIIIHYSSMHEWRVTYIYTSYCMRHFFGRIPANSKWNIDPSLYEWKILEYHIPVCLALRKKEEAERTFHLLSKKKELLLEQS